MKINIFQKIISLLFLLIVLIICIFFIPFEVSINKYETKIIFDVIWSNNTNIDLYRLLLMLFPLSLIFYFIFIYLSKINSEEQPTYKLKAKKELQIFLVFIISLITTVFVFIIINLVNQIRVRIIDNKVNSINLFITDNSVKSNLRKDFFIYSKNTYNLEEYDNNISKYWDFLMKSKSNVEWLNYYYDNFDKYILKDLGINNPTELNLFIDKNSYNVKDLENLKTIEILKEDLKVVLKKKNSINFFNFKDIRFYLIIVFVILFVLIYLFRPIYFFLKDLFKEVSSNV